MARGDGGRSPQRNRHSPRDYRSAKASSSPSLSERLSLLPRGERSREFTGHTSPWLIAPGSVQINKKKAKIILLFIIFTVPWGRGTQHTTHNSSGEALEAEGERNSRQTPLLWFLCKRNGEAQQVGLELTSLNNFCGLCSTEAVLGCLAFNPGEFRSGIKWTKVRKEGRWDYGINWLLKKRN